MRVLQLEIRSAGRLPLGVTVAQLAGRHDSKPVNPLIAGAFHRTGAVEVWGRGTNRVIAICKEHGTLPPTFVERDGFLIVTFIIQPVTEERVATQSATQSTDPVVRLLACLHEMEMPAGALRSALQIKHRPTFRANYLHPALTAGWIEYTLPDKPSSRLQKYRLTEAGKRRLEKTK